MRAMQSWDDLSVTSSLPSEWAIPDFLLLRPQRSRSLALLAISERLFACLLRADAGKLQVRRDS